jgi:hypothetical protein
VLKSLWTGSAGATADTDDTWERDLSWLGELDLGDFNWSHTGSGFYVEVTYRAQAIEVSLGFWIKSTDAGWVIAGPSTLW